MPGTNTNYGQMYDHTLEVRHGWSGDRGSVLQKMLPVSSANSNLVYGGCVVNIGTDNTFHLGVNATNSLANCRVPCFAFPNENDFDVNSDYGNIAGGTLLALCALGDFEMESTEFDSGSGEDYTAGVYLTATAEDGPPNTSDGKLKPGTFGTDVIVGIVSESGTNSDHSFTNENGQGYIRFFSWFMPDTVSAATS